MKRERKNPPPSVAEQKPADERNTETLYARIESRVRLEVKEQPPGEYRKTKATYLSNRHRTSGASLKITALYFLKKSLYI